MALLLLIHIMQFDEQKDRVTLYCSQKVVLLDLERPSLIRLRHVIFLFVHRASINLQLKKFEWLNTLVNKNYQLDKVEATTEANKKSLSNTGSKFMRKCLKVDECVCVSSICVKTWINFSLPTSVVYECISNLYLAHYSSWERMCDSFFDNRLREWIQ